MSAIIWKETRENLKWAVLWMLGVAVAMVFSLNVDPYYGYSSYQGISICSQSFLLVTTFASAIGGALLGLLQTVPEMQRDRWAFLVHRPVTRTRLFWGKAFGGLLLFVPAMGIPLIGASLWVATPGNIPAPFDWRMMLPGVADLLGGVVFYFAGMLTGMRQARWYGSRGVGISAAVVCAVLVAVAPEFWQALIAIGVFAAVLATAAWGCFHSGGEYTPQPRLAKAALGLSLLVGIVCVGAVVCGAISLLLMRTDATGTNYVINDDGRILRVSYKYGEVASVTGLDGGPIPMYDDWKKRTNVYQHMVYTPSLRSDWVWHARYRSSSRFFESVPLEGPLLWYFVFEEGRAIGYSRRDRRVVESFGPGGFAQAGSPAGPRFDGPSVSPESYQYEPLFAFPQAVYLLDAHNRTVSAVFQAGPGDEVLGACTTFQRWSQDKDATSVIAVATRDRIHFSGNDGTPRFEVPYHVDIAQYPNISIGALRDGSRTFVWYSQSYKVGGMYTPNMPSYIVEISPDGTELARHTLASLHVPWEIPWYDGLLGALSPLVFAIGAVVVGYFVGQTGGFSNPLGEASWWDPMISEHTAAFWVGSVGVVLSAVICAIIAGQVAKRFAFTGHQRRWWTTAGLLLGPLGVLMLIALRDWPARRKCPSCKRLRVVDREFCQRCEAAWDRPTADGTEVFG